MSVPVPSLAQVRLGARALHTRLRLAGLLRRHALPDLLGALDPEETPAAEPVPLAAVEAALLASERVVQRLRGLGRRVSPRWSQAPRDPEATLVDRVMPDTCLYRSLARYAVLRRAGHPARFVMGLDPRAPEIEGHAWIELHGEPLGEEIQPGLAVTFAYPSLPDP